MNAFPQFITEIDGQRVHFLHQRSPEPGALPLICTHGWPMSVFEYLDLIGPLTDPRAHGGDPADAFHVVVPSLPGVGFSGPTGEAGWDTRRIARAWARLMASLGYERYGAHGNDAGSMISPELGRHDPDRVVGVHVTQLFSFPSGDPAEFENLTTEDQAALAFLQDFQGRGGLAYNAYQSAQPQTLAYALQDSPAGWLAWVTQLFTEEVDRDYILTNASLYWLTGTIGSSIRRYYADAHTTEPPPTEPTSAPTGVAVFATDFQSIPRFADATTATSCAGRTTTGAATSPRTTPPTCCSRTSAPSTATCAERVGVAVSRLKHARGPRTPMATSSGTATSRSSLGRRSPTSAARSRRAVPPHDGCLIEVDAIAVVNER